MKYLVLTMLIAQSAYAGMFVPDISRSQINMNLSGVAAAHFQRKNISFNNAQSKNSGDNKDSSTSIAAINYFGQDHYSTEFALLESKQRYDSNDTNSYVDALILNYGYLLENGIALGTRFQHVKFSTAEDNQLSLEASKLFSNNLILGLRLKTTKINYTELKEDKRTFTAGIGYFDKGKTAAELFLSSTPSVDYKNSDSITSNDSKTVFSIIHIVDKFQISGSYEYNFDETKPKSGSSQEEDKEESSTYSFGLEYLLNKTIALGLSHETFEEKYRNDDDASDDTNTSERTIGVSLRYNVDNLLFIAGLRNGTEKKEYNDGDPDTKINSRTFDLTATYFY